MGCAGTYERCAACGELEGGALDGDGIIPELGFAVVGGAGVKAGNGLGMGAGCRFGRPRGVRPDGVGSSPVGEAHVHRTELSEGVAHVKGGRAGADAGGRLRGDRWRNRTELGHKGVATPGPCLLVGVLRGEVVGGRISGDIGAAGGIHGYAVCTINV